MPAQRRVGEMLRFPDDNTPAGRAKLLADLRKSQQALETQSNEAAAGITEMVQKDQKQFQTQINTRIKALTDGLSPVMPTITAPGKLVLL
jgi:hypothetical protein